MTADDDYKLLQNGIGFTNMVERATKGSADLTRKEIKEGLFSIIWLIMYYLKCCRYKCCMLPIINKYFIIQLSRNNSKYLTTQFFTP